SSERSWHETAYSHYPACRGNVDRPGTYFYCSVAGQNSHPPPPAGPSYLGREGGALEFFCAGENSRVFAPGSMISSSFTSVPAGSMAFAIFSSLPFESLLPPEDFSVAFLLGFMITS